MDILKNLRIKFIKSTLFTLTFCLVSASASAATVLSPSDVADLKLLDGQPATIAEKGKTLLYFWASWCPDCRTKLQSKLPEWHAQNGVRVITVNTDKVLERAEHFVEKEKIAVPVARDEEKRLQKALKVFGVPAWAVVEKRADGLHVIASETGSDVERLEAALKQ